MPTQQKRRARLCRLMAALLALSACVSVPRGLPAEIHMTAGSSRPLKLTAVTASILDESVATIEPGNTQTLTAVAGGETRLRLRWLDLLPVGDVRVRVSPEKRLIPGGQNVGVALRTDGVVVVGASDPNGIPSPARKAGIRSGDVIRAVDGVRVTGSAQLSRLIPEEGEVTLTVARGEKERTVSLNPVRDSSGQRRIGAWVRDSTAGVGTLTFIDPETGAFGALGHAIQDVDTLTTLPVAEGEIYESEVVGVMPGLSGAPGELMGSFFEKARSLGKIEKNTAFGIFGRYTSAADGSRALPVGGRETVREGAAQLLTTLEDGETRAYGIEIERLYPQDSPAVRSMILRVTDEALLRRTGGIVQGMSGSPILQDGKIVGCVTHVFLNDPTRGYGVYIDWMLEECES